MHHPHPGDAPRAPRPLDDVESLAGLGSFTWEVEGDMAVWSDNLCRMQGADPGSRTATFSSFLQGVHPDDRDRVERTIGGALRGEAPYEFETRTLRPDGSVGWLYVHGRVERAPDRAPVRVFGIVQNVTERRRAQQALLDSEESYRAVFEASSDAIYVLDRDTGAILDVNPAACALNGYPPEEMRALGIAGLSADREPYDWASAQELIRLAAAGEPQRVEWLARHRSGRDVWGEVTLQRVAILGEARVLATARDITDRKAAEEARARAEAQAQRTASRMRAVAGAAAGVIGAASTEALQGVLEAACRQVIACDTFALALYDAVSHTFEYPDGHDGAERYAASRIRAAGTPGERVVSTRRSLITRRADDPAGAGSIVAGTPRRSESIIRTPVLGGDRVLGILVVQSYTPDLYDAADAEVLETLASLAATALRNLELLAEREAAAAALRRANEELERRVEERTAELADTNLALEEEIAGHETASEELRRRTEELEGVFRALPDLFFRMTHEGVVTEHRSGGAALPPEAYLGRSLPELLAELVPADAAARIRQAVAEVARTRELVCVEYPLAVDGAPREFEARLLPLEDGSLIAVVRDITDRKEAERELRRREAHFRRVIESTSDLVLVVDTGAVFTYVSPSISGVLGYAPDELTGTSALDLLHPDDTAFATRELGRIVSVPGAASQSVLRLRHRDGSHRWVESLARTLSPDGAEAGLLVNARDVTERREAELRLREQRAYYEQLIAGLDVGIVAWDPQARFEYVSPNSMPDPALRAWAIGKDQFEYAAHRGVAPGLARMRHRSVMGAVETRRQTEYEEAIRRPDGSPLHLLRRSRPILDENGEVVRVIGYSVDITERKHTEEALRLATAEAERAREAAERANRAKSEFLSRMSHELRTPMNSILGFAQLLDRAGLPPEHRKGVGHILRAGRHLLNLINEVLEIARIEAGRPSLSLEPVRLDTVMHEALSLVRPLAAQGRIELDDGPWPCCGQFVQADRQRLTQVLLNVVTNAVKYNRAGGRVRVSCETLHEGDAAARLAVRVADTGRGIPHDRVDQLFTPFARLGAEQSEVEGTGLGLALSLRLAEAMGGALVLESTGAEGSVFRLELRLADDPLQRLEDGDAAARAPDGVPHAPARILYIEDNLANLSLVETILLSRPRWRTLPALQGLVGVELAREHVPDLVLLDLHLPDVSGEEVLRRLRAEPATAAIPVVVITADATRSAVGRLRAAGADAYLTKPLDIDEFLNTLERFLPAAPGGG